MMWDREYQIVTGVAYAKNIDVYWGAGHEKFNFAVQGALPVGYHCHVLTDKVVTAGQALN